MNRRAFLYSLVIAPFVAKIKIPVKTAYGKLFGIPYHETNATSGTWLGFDRSVMPQWSYKPAADKPISKELIAMIKKLMDDGMKHYDK
jgi:hypothetical protein